MARYLVFGITKSAVNGVGLESTSQDLVVERVYRVRE